MDDGERKREGTCGVCANGYRIATRGGIDAGRESSLVLEVVNFFRMGRGVAPRLSYPLWYDAAHEYDKKTQ